MNECPLTGKPCSQPKLYHSTEIVSGGYACKDFCIDCAGAYFEILHKQYKVPLREESPVLKKLKLMGELLGLFVVHPKQGSVENAPECPKCGATHEFIKSKGKVGCAYCYIFYEDQLIALLGKIQAGTEHVGKVPKHFQEQQDKLPIEIRIKNLEDKLQKTLKSEDFEAAAIIRDEIKKIMDHKD